MDVRADSVSPRCGWCGKPAAGLATINETRYCHDDEAEVTCYERASRLDDLDDAAQEFGVYLTSTPPQRKPAPPPPELGERGAGPEVAGL